MSPLVERHGSDIEVESEVEENGTFTMVLPTKKAIAWRTWVAATYSFPLITFRASRPAPW